MVGVVCWHFLDGLCGWLYQDVLRCCFLDLPSHFRVFGRTTAFETDTNRADSECLTVTVMYTVVNEEALPSYL
jgi:hypothetical protein